MKHSVLQTNKLENTCIPSVTIDYDGCVDSGKKEGSVWRSMNLMAYKTKVDLLPATVLLTKNVPSEC
ncbi:hypothetical protein GCM10011409_43000 [Lentibacillus populi]|uniref:Uncharacterized protein n=1 Tax=Lentibacillus populi TaxID=1827502 RepID=A0A9W5U1L9_9BACI|nr:hypothetical protein GCM10011409_43000 [Lentibacillus populi]